jgi:hypothetical protein
MRKHLIFLLAILSIILNMFSNCEFPNIYTEGSFYIYGNIYDVTGDPLQDVTISIINIKGSNPLPIEIAGTTDTTSDDKGYYVNTSSYGIGYKTDIFNANTYILYVDYLEIQYSKTGYHNCVKVIDYSNNVNKNELKEKINVQLIKE